MMVLAKTANQMPCKARLVLAGLMSRGSFVWMDQEKTADGDE